MRSRVSLPLLLAVGLAGCADGTGPETPNVADLELTAPTTRMVMGAALQLEAVAVGPTGQPMANVPITWQSDAPEVAAVDATGRVEATAHGSARISATAGTLTRSVELSVVQKPSSCTETGTTASSVTDSTVWRAADGPYHLEDTVVVSDALVVEAGTLVCGGAGGLLEVDGPPGGTLVAAGAEGDSVVFTARDPGEPWRGILSGANGGPIELRHARLEYAVFGVSGWNAPITIADVHVRQIEESAVSVGRDGSVTRVAVDTARIGIYLGNSRSVELKQIVIRGARDHGIETRRSSFSLDEVRIEGSGGVGILMDPLAADLEGATDVFVTGGASYPLEVTMAAAMLLLPDSATAARFTGNALDEVFVSDGSYATYTLAGDATLAPALDWHFISTVVQGNGTLRIGPGTDVRLSSGPGGLTVSGDARLEVAGAPDRPATVTGPNIIRRLLRSPNPMTVRHAVLTGLPLTDSAGAMLTIDSSVVRNGSITLVDPASRLTDVTVEAGPGEYIYGPDAAVAFLGAGTRATRLTVTGSTGHGVRIDAPNVTLTGCTITGSAGDGVLVTNGSGVAINQCNLTDNAGPGVNNTSAATVDAAQNWWGDPAGPNGPNGDGVAGPVTVAPVLTAPVAATVAALLRLR